MYVCFIIKSSSSGSNNNSSPRCYSIVMGSAVSAAAPSVSREQSSQQLLLTITTQNSSPRLMLLHSTNIFMVVMLTLALAILHCNAEDARDVRWKEQSAVATCYLIQWVRNVKVCSYDGLVHGPANCISSALCSSPRRVKARLAGGGGHWELFLHFGCICICSADSRGQPAPTQRY